MIAVSKHCVIMLKHIYQYRSVLEKTNFAIENMEKLIETAYVIHMSKC